MASVRSLLLGILVIALTVSFVGANFVTVSERTVLDAGFVKEAAEEEGVYELVQTEVSEQVGAESFDGGELPLPVSTREVVDEALNNGYLQKEGEDNIDRVYGYLHGDRDEPRIAVDLEPLKANVTAAVEYEIRNASLKRLLSMLPNRSMSSRTGYTTFSTFAEMAKSEDRFDEIRAQFREDLREELRMEADGEPTDAEIDALLEERLSEMRRELRTRVEENLSGGDVPPELQGPVEGLAYAGIDGLLTDTTYGAYVSRLEEAKGGLASGAASTVQQKMEEVPDTMEFTEKLPPEALSNLERARRGVTTLDTLAVALPILAALLVAGIFLISRSPATTALLTGGAASLAGAVGYGSARFAGARIGSAISGAEIPPGAVGPVLGLTGRVLDVLSTQSLVLLIIGLVLVSLGVALRRLG